jgi:hypothetical protein
MLRSLSTKQNPSFLLAARASSTTASPASPATAATSRRVPFIPSKARQDDSHTVARDSQPKPSPYTKQLHVSPHARQPGPHATRPAHHSPFHPANIKPVSNRPPGNRKTVKPDGVKLLRPAVFTQRLTALFDQGKHDEAVEALKNAPFDATSPPTWNTVIGRVMELGKFQLAYRLYIDVSAVLVTRPSVLLILL